MLIPNNYFGMFALYTLLKEHSGLFLSIFDVLRLLLAVVQDLLHRNNILDEVCSLMGGIE